MEEQPLKSFFEKLKSTISELSMNAVLATMLLILLAIDLVIVSVIAFAAVIDLLK